MIIHLLMVAMLVFACVRPTTPKPNGHMFSVGPIAWSTVTIKTQILGSPAESDLGWLTGEDVDLIPAADDRQQSDADFKRQLPSFSFPCEFSLRYSADSSHLSIVKVHFHIVTLLCR